MRYVTKGSKVVVRDYAGRPLTRLVWEVGSRCVYICTEEQMEMLLNDDRTAAPIGFPIEDVFEYDERANCFNGGMAFDWGALRCFKDFCASAT